MANYPFSYEFVARAFWNCVHGKHENEYYSMDLPASCGQIIEHLN